MEEHSVIQAVDRRTVARICSGQVVIELAVAVKELVENALDAGATQVEVRLREFGVSGFEVTDNGSGIAADNYAGLTAKYHTSKLNTFEDLASVSSFGFRGEAVSSLCELSGQFQVTTRTAASPAAAKLTYARNGELLKQEPAAHPIGTTVSVTELFAPLPVRRQEFVRSGKKQYGKMLRVLQAYALTASNVRLSCYNVTTKNGGAAGGGGGKSKSNGSSASAGSKREQVLSTQGCGDLSGAIANVWGAKFLSTLQTVKVGVVVAASPGDGNQAGEEDATFNSHIFSSYGNGSSDVSNSSSNSSSSSSMTDTGEAMSEAAAAAAAGPPPAQSPAAASKVKSVHGMVSRVGCGVGRSDNDRQFIFLNNRPVDLPKVVKVVNEVWRCYEMKHKPAFCLHVTWPSHLLDVNLTPDKREVALVGDKDLVASLKQGLHDLWAPTRSTFEVNAAAVGGSSSSSSNPLFLSPATPSFAEGPSSVEVEAKAGAGAGGDDVIENERATTTASAAAGTLPEEAASETTKATAMDSTVAEEEVDDDEESNEPSLVSSRQSRVPSSANKRQVAITDAFAPSQKKEKVARAEKRRSRNSALDDDEGSEKDREVEDDNKKNDDGKLKGGNDDDDDEDDDDEEEEITASGAERSKAKRSRNVPEESSASVITDSKTNAHSAHLDSARPISSRKSAITTTETPFKIFSAFAKSSSSNTTTTTTTTTTNTTNLSTSSTSTAAPCWECGDPSSGTCDGCCAGFGGKNGVPYCKDCYAEVHASSAISSSNERHAWRPFTGSTHAKKRPAPRTASATPIKEGSDDRDNKDAKGAEVVLINDDDDGDDDDDHKNGEESEAAVESMRSPGATNAPAVAAPFDSGAGSPACPPPPTPEEERGSRNEQATAGGGPSNSSNGSSSSAFGKDGSRSSADNNPNGKSSENRENLDLLAAKGAIVEEHEEEEGATNGLNPNQHASRDRSLYVNLTTTLAAAARAAHRKQKKRARLLQPPFAGPGAESNAAAAAGAMSEDIGTQAASSAPNRSTRVLTKGDFARLEVLGQFNLGFAVCRLDRDLFILDQHACEEKALFESLQRSTKLHEQQLLRPMPFECSASEEAVILDHLPVFAFNGFKFQAPMNDNDNNNGGNGSNDNENGCDAPQGSRLKLLTRPHSKGTVFGDDDIHELASLLAENPYEMPPETTLNSNSSTRDNGLLTAGAGPGGSGGSSDYSSSSGGYGHNGGGTGPVPRLPKVVSMFASRACRSAVMIGTALDRSALTKIVRRLEGVEQPWNCPHGRPTMRHLADLTDPLTATVAEAD